MVFRKHFPNLQEYKQPFLIERFVRSETVYDAHEAEGDCINLKALIEKAANEKRMTVVEFIGESINFSDF